MFFLSLILFSLFAGSGLFGALESHEPFVLMQTKKIYNGPLRSLSWGEDAQSGVSLLRITVGTDEQQFILRACSLDRMPLVRFKQELAALTKHEFCIGPSAYGNSYEVQMVGSPKSVQQITPQAGKRICSIRLAKNGCSLAIGLSDGTLQIYQRVIHIADLAETVPVSTQQTGSASLASGASVKEYSVKQQPWSAWLWAQLRKPRVYVPLLIFCAAAVFGGYYGKSSFASKLKKSSAK